MSKARIGRARVVSLNRIPLLLILLATAGCGGPGSSPTEDLGLPKGRILFDHAPIDISGVRSFVPMGEPNVFPKEHGGFPLLTPSFPPHVPVIAVGDGVITAAQRGTRHVPENFDIPEAGQAYDDWGFTFRVSDVMIVNYAHVTMLHPDLMAQLGSQPADEIGRNVTVRLQAGDTIGWVGPHAAMDFSIKDFTLELSFLNPSRYPTDHTFAANIFDYFREPVRSALLGIAARALPPRGGKIDYDVAGRISGNWFQVGTTSFLQHSRKLAIVYDHLSGDRVFISDGSPMRDVPGFEGPGAPDIYWVRGNEPKPEAVGVSEGLVRYVLILPGAHLPDDQKNVLGIMLVQAIDSGSIRVEIFKGVEDAAGFTAAAKVYER